MEEPEEEATQFFANNAEGYATGTQKDELDNSNFYNTPCSDSHKEVAEGPKKVLLVLLLSG